MKKQNACAAPAGTLSRRCRRAKQLTVIVLSVLAACVMFAVQVLAAEINPANFIAVTGKVLRALIIMVGAGLAVFGVINLLEGYGSDNAANKSQGIKQTMAGAAVIMAGVLLVPVLTGMMSDAMSAS